MNKKLLCALGLLMMISLTTGIFTEILSTDEAALSTETALLLPGFLNSIKKDAATVLACILLSVTIYLVPFVVALVMGKLFSIGYAAAWLLSAAEKGHTILLAVLLPRCLLRLPVYMALIYFSFQTAGSIKESRRISLPVKGYSICFGALAVFSLFEAFLLQCAV